MELVNECLEFLSVYYTRRTCKIQQNHKRIPSKYTLRCVRRIDTIEFTKNLLFYFQNDMQQWMIAYCVLRDILTKIRFGYCFLCTLNLSWMVTSIAILPYMMCVTYEHYIYYWRKCSRIYAEGNDGKMDCTSDMYYQLKRE